eukprot:11275662-Alexandrium_andersonii.AAC.1
MSASLVGSEMCIRDSPGLPPKSASSARAGGAFWLVSWEAVAPPGRSRGGPGGGSPPGRARI